MKNNALSVMVAEQDEKLEWERLIGPLWDNRWRIAAVTGLAGVLGVAYALLATPVYQSHGGGAGGEAAVRRFAAA